MLRNLLDRLGIMAGFACTLHCLFLPFIPLLPLLMLSPFFSFMNESVMHMNLVLGLIALGVLSTVIGFLKHGHYRALVTMGLAVFIGLVIAMSHEWLEARPFAHGFAYALLGTLTLIAHFLNFRLSHGHVHDARCQGN